MAQAVQNGGENNRRLVCRIFTFTPIRGQILVGIDRDVNDIEYVLDVQDGSIDQGMEQTFDKQQCSSTMGVTVFGF